jgi:type IV pilus assembly protein PilY1
LTFQIKSDGAGNALIKDPLWYAAKYGSFDSSKPALEETRKDEFDPVNLPTETQSWDKTDVNGTPGSDGIPDGYFLARRPELLEQQLRRALDEVAKASSSAPAVSSSQLSNGAYKYVAKFDSSAISGDIQAFKVDKEGLFKAIPDFSVAQLLTERTRGTNGKSGNKGEDRVIITNTGNASSTGIKFRADAALNDYFGTAYKLSDPNKNLLVNYLRGDYTEEGPTKLRDRKNNILGPVVNATPWIQTAPTAAYAGSKFDGYSPFAIRHKARKQVLWVSSNDGMLHAFDAEPLDPTSTPLIEVVNPTIGKEIFAYVPGAIANRLAEIPSQRTGVKSILNGKPFIENGSQILPTDNVLPYVDGNPFSGDVKVGTGATAEWRTYVFSALGRGGKGIFALDATNIGVVPDGAPSGDAKLTDAETGSTAQKIFKWQFTSDDDADFGYLTSEYSFSPASRQATPIAKLNNGKFAILLGNGYKSTTGKAALFMLYVDGPEATGSWSGRYKKIIADNGKKNTTTGAVVNDPNYNGLSAPTWVDSDGDGAADIVYAGDLQGNMWKFDISDTDATKWDVAYKEATANKPLFVAKDGNKTLPISTAPEYAFPPFEGLVITFGTGNAFEELDFPNKSVTQRVFGVLDRPSFKTQGGELIPASSSTLVERTYARDAKGYVVTTNSADIDWQGAADPTKRKDGWFFKLPGESEMVLSDPDIKVGVLTFTTVRPKTNLDLCSASPDVSLFTIDPVSGKNDRNIQGEVVIGGETVYLAATEIADQRIKNVVDNTKAPFKVPPKDCTTVGGVETCKPTPLYCSGGQRSVRAIGQGTNTNWCYTPGARTQWREIPGLRTDQ